MTETVPATTSTSEEAGPTFRVTSGFWEQLPQMSLEKYPATQGFIDDVYVNPDGVPMCSGYFELRHTDAPLDYYYDYDEMKVVLEGEFRLENVDTGQVQIAKAKDAIFFPKGSRILFSTPDRALAFYTGYRSFAP